MILEWYLKINVVDESYKGIIFCVDKIKYL